MTLDRLRPLTDRLLEPFVTASVRLGLTPNSVSVLALLVAGGAAGAFSIGPSTPVWYLAGAFLVFLNGLLDLLDGAIARELGTESAAGDLLDHVFDRYADLLLLVGLAGGIDRWDLGVAAITGVLMTSYLGTQAQAVGLDRVYGGLLGRADRLALTGVAGVAVFVYTEPIRGLTVIGWLLVFFAVVGHFTAIQRLVSSLRNLD
ncbi:CDP-alcohol phosphatidyltransferase family protein [Halorhabdus sp. CBA1104]|uniref:CDP-alcohol phosphatidyltransferase family protein n=1 Tax=unclassified Halorhabdus TaxID=2621901 RepID=UPI0012B241F6|nr:MULTISPECIES: CDP-alcohol phosphatidyltransferase family protein [unclassified Halorhabdus]QGN06864.1 CDP-alcohol phosphatidyltransferase family protein [Halorhabdus sp. CBA1104]